MENECYRRNLFILILACFAILLSGYSQCETPTGPMPPDLVQAGYYLDSDDYVVVRRGIRLIEKNIKEPNILPLVKPLSEVAMDSNGRRDAYSRCIAVPVLLRIGVSHSKTGPGRKAIETVIYLLHNSPADLVRGTCANAIGISGYSDAVGNLEDALNDPSIYVQTEACTALLRLTNEQYSSPECNPGSMSSETQAGILGKTANGVMSQEALLEVDEAQSQNDNRSREVIDWLRTHIMLPMPTDGQ